MPRGNNSRDHTLRTPVYKTWLAYSFYAGILTAGLILTLLPGNDWRLYLLSGIAGGTMFMTLNPKLRMMKFAYFALSIVGGFQAIDFHLQLFTQHGSLWIKSPELGNGVSITIILVAGLALALDPVVRGDVNGSLLNIGSKTEIGIQNVRNIETKGGDYIEIQQFFQSEERHLISNPLDIQSLPSESKWKTRLVGLLQKRFKDLLEQKLDNRDFVKVAYKYTLSGSSRGNISRLYYDNSEGENLNETILQILSNHRFLLIMGGEGAGKTTLLLQTALSILNDNTRNTEVFPFIFNISSFLIDEESLTHWMDRLLRNHYGVSRQMAKVLFRENLVVPLFDGLDELLNRKNLGVSHQANNFVTQLNSFLNTKKAPKYVVISSRINEYLQMGGNAPVDAQIMIKNFSTKNVFESFLEPAKSDRGVYYGANRTACSNLFEMASRNKVLLEVLRIPFYHNLAMQTFIELGDYTIKFGDDKGVIKESLVKMFFNRKLISGFHNYSVDKKKRHLLWLANWMATRGKTDFELADFQPEDFHSRSRIILLATQNLLIGMAFGIITILSLILIFSTHEPVKEALPFYLSLASLVGTTTTLVLVIKDLFSFSRKRKWISTKERVFFNIRPLFNLENFLSIIAYGVLGGGSGVVIGASISTVIGLVFAPELISLFFISGFLKGFIPGAVLGILYQTKNLILFEKQFIEIRDPYYKLRSGIFRNSILASIFFILGIYLFAIIDYESSYFPTIWFNGIVTLYSIVIGSMMGLIFAIMNSPRFKHHLLVIFLRLSGKIRGLNSFFRYCVEVRILEYDGGRWKFRHQVLFDSLYHLNNEN